MKYFFFCSTLFVMLFSCKGAEKITETEVVVDASRFANETDSMSYIFGYALSENMKSQNLDHLNMDILVEALNEGIANQDSAIEVENSPFLIAKYIEKQKEILAQKNIERGKAFLTENKLKEGVIEIESGLQYKVLIEGNGPVPTRVNEVQVHYTGKTLDGNVFDSSVERGKPEEFGVTRLIKGWTEALLLMPVGSKWELYIPSELAYGNRGAGEDIGPGELLLFEIELLKITK